MWLKDCTRRASATRSMPLSDCQHEFEQIVANDTILLDDIDVGDDCRRGNKVSNRIECLPALLSSSCLVCANSVPYRSPKNLGRHWKDDLL